MTIEAEHAADTPEEEPSRFRFTLMQMMVVTAACAVCLGVGSWTGDFILWPPLVGVILLLTFRTQGGVTPGLIFGFTIAMGILVTVNLPNVPDKHVKILAFGALGVGWRRSFDCPWPFHFGLDSSVCFGLSDGFRVATRLSRRQPVGQA